MPCAGSNVCRCGGGEGRGETEGKQEGVRGQDRGRGNLLSSLETVAVITLTSIRNGLNVQKAHIGVRSQVILTEEVSRTILRTPSEAWTLVTNNNPVCS